MCILANVRFYFYGYTEQPKHIPRKQNLLNAVQNITKTCLFKYTENFTIKKWKISDKKFWYF